MYKSCVKKTQTEAKVVAYSVSEETGEKIITFELQYPRLVHSEMMTHRLFTRNAASSRAIPVSNLLKWFESVLLCRFALGLINQECKIRGQSIMVLFKLGLIPL